MTVHLLLDTEFLLIKDHLAKDQGGLFCTPRNFLVYFFSERTIWTLHVHLVDWTGWISHVHLVDWTGKNAFLLIKDHMSKDQGELFCAPRNFLVYFF